MKMKRIIFTGAQGTGKTSVLNYFKDNGYNCITEVVRNLSKEGVKINEMGDLEGQDKIFNTYKELLSPKKSYISDRGLTDVVSYTHYLVNLNDKCDFNYYQLLYTQLIDLFNFTRYNDDIIYCYFPIEFPVVDDGVRSIDEKFRSEIDSNIKNLLEVLNIKYYTITGTLEERIDKVKEIINFNAI